MLASSAVNSGFETPGQVKPKTEIGICCFSAKHEALKRKIKDWLDQKQDNESEWGNMSTGKMLFQWSNVIKNPAKYVGLVQGRPHHHLINLFSPWYSWKIAELALNNN